MTCCIRIVTARCTFGAQVAVGNESLMDAIVDCLKFFGFQSLDGVVGVEVVSVESVE